MSDWAIPDSICPAATMRRLSTEPCVACVTATRPGTPQLPPCSHGGEPAGFEIAAAITPPISKKVPEVDAAPIRKNCPSCALGDTRPKRRTKIAAATGPQHQTPNLADIVSPLRQQFRKTTWITPDCNSAPPAEGESRWCSDPFKYASLVDDGQCCHQKFCHTGEACPCQGTGGRCPWHTRVPAFVVCSGSLARRSAGA